ncbi:MAG: NAD(P)(+) transhydrogenase (Re/Si-specific) subunit beta, partial [Neisseriaceae bacterium]|nr:NAD(P)(+) transhydrogenase (Re/Si-specific) subunit beta [Neisseriaceae bacterium]
MATGIVTSAYIIAAIFFILALAGLSKQETAKNGNMFGMIGMAIALIATVCSESVQGLGWIIIAMIAGGAVGVYKAKKVEMTQMPELIALLHSFVGLTAVLVGFNSFIQSDNISADMHTVHLIEVFLGVFIGAVTFTGSLVAWGKLKGKISGKPMMLPHK